MNSNRAWGVTKKSEVRGKEIWRRKGQPETSKRMEIKGKSNQEDEVSTRFDSIKSIHIQVVGNGCLNRSAIGKMKRLISA